MPWIVSTDPLAEVVCPNPKHYNERGIIFLFLKVSVPVLPYVNRNPDMRDFTVTPPGQTIPARVTVSNLNGGRFPNGDNWSYNYNRANPLGDFRLADQAYRDLLGPGNENWQRPPNTTWHHHEDCNTMN